MARGEEDAPFVRLAKSTMRDMARESFAVAREGVSAGAVTGGLAGLIGGPLPGMVGALAGFAASQTQQIQSWAKINPAIAAEEHRNRAYNFVHDYLLSREYQGQARETLRRQREAGFYERELEARAGMSIDPAGAWSWWKGRVSQGLTELFESDESHRKMLRRRLEAESGSRALGEAIGGLSRGMDAVLPADLSGGGAAGAGAAVAQGGQPAVAARFRWPAVQHPRPAMQNRFEIHLHHEDEVTRAIDQIRGHMIRAVDKLRNEVNLLGSVIDGKAATEML